MRGVKGSGPQTERKPKLAHETRSYEVSEAELSLWLTGESRFHVLEIKPTPAGGVEFIVSTRKQAEPARPFRTVNETRAEHGLPPIDPEAEARFEDEAASEGPAILDDGEGGPVGTADPVPMIATRGEAKRLKTRRELDAERIKNGQAPIGGPRINHIADDDPGADPVPSALPR